VVHGQEEAAGQAPIERQLHHEDPGLGLEPYFGALIPGTIDRPYSDYRHMESVR